jgi:hypothetical protein
MAIANVHVRAMHIQKTKTENNKARYPRAHRSKMGRFGGFRHTQGGVTSKRPNPSQICAVGDTKPDLDDVPMCHHDQKVRNPRSPSPLPRPGHSPSQYSAATGSHAHKLHPASKIPTLAPFSAYFRLVSDKHKHMTPAHSPHRIYPRFAL